MKGVSTQDFWRATEDALKEFFQKAIRGIIIIGYALLLLGIILISIDNWSSYRIALSLESKSLIVQKGAFFPWGYRLLIIKPDVYLPSGWPESLPDKRRKQLIHGIRCYGQKGVQREFITLLLTLAESSGNGGTIEFENLHIQYLREALRISHNKDLNPRLASAYSSLANIYMEIGDSDSAIRALNSGRLYGLEDVDPLIAEFEEILPTISSN